MRIKITLLSDLCPASGEGTPGIVDAEIAVDEHGIPYLPARRIKGCLRDAARELKDVLGERFPVEVYESMFGKTGSSGTGWLQLGNGYPEDYEDMIEDLRQLKEKNSVYRAFLNRERVLSCFTVTRSQTSIDRETGTAKRDTLRTIRTIRKGTVFYVPVKLLNPSTEGLELLENICKVFRHMGLGRTRGYGWIRCELVKEESKPEHSSSSGWGRIEGKTGICDSGRDHVQDGRMLQLFYRLALKSPLLVIQRVGSRQMTESYITGSTILGVMASRYLNHNNITKDDAHTDPTFRRIFLEGDVRFLNAYLYDEDLMGEYKPMPQSLVQIKDSYEIYDLACEENEKFLIRNDIQTKKMSGFYAVQGYEADFRGPVTEIVYHHARPENERTLGHAREEDGAFFQYEVLKKGQIFHGSIIGPEQDLKILRNLIGDGELVQIGRSRTAQYAEVEWRWQEENLDKEYVEDKWSSDLLVVSLVSPMILRNQYGHLQPDPELFVDILRRKYPRLELKKSFVKTIRIGGFQSKWLLPKTQLPALDAGTVLILALNGEQIDPGAIANDSYGLRINEGFGRISIHERFPLEWASKESDEGFVVTKRAEESDKGEYITPMHAKVHELLAAIQWEMLKEEVKMMAIKRFSRNTGRLTNSAINRLLGILEENPRQETFFQRVKELMERARGEPYQAFYSQFSKLDLIQAVLKSTDLYTLKKEFLVEEIKDKIEKGDESLFVLFYKTLLKHRLWINRHEKVKKKGNENASSQSHG